MTLVGILVGLLNCLLLAVILVLVGAVCQWVLQALGWPPPVNVVKLFLAVVALVFLICIILLLVGTPMVHIIHISGVAPAIV